MIESTIRKQKKLIEKINVITDGVCNRCLGTNIAKDYLDRLFCMDCYTYGEMSGERYLYRYEREVKGKNHILNVDYKLSEMQKKGSDFLMECFEKRKKGFLHAVCGAGKTEMTYNVILQAVNQNHKVCFVLPRVQVLNQVFKRFQTHFPKTIIKKLCQDYKDYDFAHIIISTPQQLINFHKEFELIIVDENDAFPLKNNVFLQRLIDKAKSDEGVIIYMSATITKSFEEVINQKKLEYLLIPERYHFRDLPIPKFLKCNDHRRNTSLASFIQIHQKNNKQFLMFVPSIAKAKKYHDHYKQKYKCAYITSETKNKSELIDAFQREVFLFLITTSVLERGVTFKAIDVIVMEADHEIYTKDTLVQIAGRVDRSLEQTFSEVLFYSQYISIQMVESKKEIMKMNRIKNHEM